LVTFYEARSGPGNDNAALPAAAMLDFADVRQKSLKGPRRNAFKLQSDAIVATYTISATACPAPPSMRCDSDASMKSSRSPSSTSEGLLLSTPVRRSFTSW
jgi:hypothetical protein